MASKAEHRRKRKIKVDQNSPFPVPISTLTFVSPKQNYWFYYTGNLIDDHVEVSHSGDIHFLYTMGFFGKGLISRGAPELLQHLPNVHIPTQDGKTDVLKVMRKRMYLRHKQWQQAEETTGDENSGGVPENLVEFDSDVDYSEYTEQYEPIDVPVQSSDLDCDDNADTGMEIREIQENETDRAKGPFEATDASWDGNYADIDFWDADNSDETPKAAIVDEWENKEADHDFWGTPDNTAVNSLHISEDMKGDCNEHTNKGFDNKFENHRNALGPDDKGDNFHSNKHVLDGSQDENDTCSPSKRFKPCDGKSGSSVILFKETAPKSADNEMNVDDHQGYESNTNCLSNSDVSFSSLRNTQPREGTNTVKGAYSSQSNSQNVETTAVRTNISNDDKNANTDDIVSVEEASSSKFNSQHIENVVVKTDISDDDKNANTDDNVSLEEASSSKFNSQHVENIAVKPDVSDENTITGNPSKTNANNASDIDNVPYHSCCLDEEHIGDYLVIEDSDCDDRLTNAPVKKIWKWKPVRKIDVYPYVEPLLLSLEEAFFLSYGLGCLTVKDETNTALSLPAMWCQFCDRKQGFLPNYVAYHYFRSKGWVPKSGVVFGVDFIVYREGPPFYHSSYSVIIKTVYEGDYEGVAEYTNRQITWTSFAGLNRVTEHVAKTLMLCYVIMPREVTKEELQSPLCLSKFKIKLQLVNRWVSSQEREKDKEQEIP